MSFVSASLYNCNSHALFLPLPFYILSVHFLSISFSSFLFISFSFLFQAGGRAVLLTAVSCSACCAMYCRAVCAAVLCCCAVCWSAAMCAGAVLALCCAVPRCVLLRCVLLRCVLLRCVLLRCVLLRCVLLCSVLGGRVCRVVLLAICCADLAFYYHRRPLKSPQRENLASLWRSSSTSPSPHIPHPPPSHLTLFISPFILLSLSLPDLSLSFIFSRALSPAFH
jgi:hypothetical protein